MDKKFNLSEIIAEMLSEAPENSVHSKNRTADGQTKDPKTEKPKANTSADTQGVLGKTKGTALDAGAGMKDVGGEKGKNASKASADTQGVLGKTSGTALDAHTGKDEGGEKGKNPSDASADTQGVLGKTKGTALDAGGGMDDKGKKLKEASAEPSNSKNNVKSQEQMKTSADTQGVLGKTKGTALDAGGGKDVGKLKEDDAPGEDDEEDHDEEEFDEEFGDDDDSDEDDDDDDVKESSHTDGPKKISLAGPKGSKVTATNKGGKWVSEESDDDEEDEDDNEVDEETSADTQGVLGKTKGTALDAGGDKDVGKKLKEEGDHDDDEDDDDLNEDFKVKAQIIFETAVNEKTALIREELEADYEAKLAEELEVRDAAIQQYVEYAVNEWLTENALEIKYSLRTEIAENFIRGLKGLFEESYIDIPEEEVSVVDELTESVSAYKDQLAELEEEVAASRLEILELKHNNVIAGLSEDLTQTQALKLRDLAKNVEASDIEEFEFKLASLKESYFSDVKNPSYSSLTEEVIGGTGVQHLDEDSPMSMYANFLSKVGR